MLVALIDPTQKAPNQHWWRIHRPPMRCRHIGSRRAATVRDVLLAFARGDAPEPFRFILGRPRE
jgi:hypothetical protein